MRLVQVTIPAGKRQAVLSVLDEEGIDYVVTEETSGREYTAVAYFPLPTNAVEPILEELREVGLDREAYTVVLSAETVVSERFEQLKESYAEKEESEERIARQELEARAEELASSLPTYVVMTVVSAIIATAGLLLDSPATVVGSMVIAPLIGPAMAAAVGSVIDDTDLFRRGAVLQLLGVVLSIVAATAFAIFVQTTNLVPPGLDPLALSEVEERLSPNFLSLAVAIGAGVAGAVSLMTGVSAALVGVMIAVALIPPAATVGIGIAYGEPSLALGSAVLVAVNVLSINLAALVVLWYSGYRPQQFFQRDQARVATLKRVVFLVGAIAVLSLFLGGVTFDSYQTATTEQDIRAGVDAELEDPAYDGYELVELEVGTTSEYVLFHRPSEVVVTVGVPPDAPRPGLAAAIDQRLAAEYGLDVDVQVRYLEIEES
ncbi:TIGR00341 family protein [Natronomonas gomsonensis]|uniref:TIGR00341 family protein n=1 Tax=Natronomonas gomsonensis TaxID=1046043 RepID=UPI0020CA7C26|nr:TIGR00341 family protein [Natronomonas gomsonensis]MCY4731272.1 TIGR00341 family protein [Natronomonas gomsonensis]